MLFNKASFMVGALVSSVFLTTSLLAHTDLIDQPVKVLVDLKTAKILNLKIDSMSEISEVVTTTLSPEQASLLSEYQHSQGKCGGFQVIPNDAVQGNSLNYDFKNLDYRVQLEKAYSSLVKPLALTPKAVNPQIKSAIDMVKASNVKAFVEWFSSFPNRYNRGSTPNQAITALNTKIQTLLAGSKLKWSIDEISHNSTPQKSLRVSITGTQSPDQIIVLGGHADSINGWGFSPKAPGADDNASGSGTLYEALRILSEIGEQPKRTIEFFWYGGEESGLLGSAEIAATYKQAQKDVVAVLQLDMTAYPGKGSNVIGSVQDFTSSWLKDYLLQINNTYLGLKIVADNCGYACSDHASWYEKGYPTLMPFESDTKTMNRNIHTERDVASILDFDHAAHFAKIAVIFAMDLGNSTAREPIQ